LIKRIKKKRIIKEGIVVEVTINKILEKKVNKYFTIFIKSLTSTKGVNFTL